MEMLKNENNFCIIKHEHFIYLISYESTIIKYDIQKKVVIKLWDGWTSTTAKHINIFMSFIGLDKITKSQYITACVGGVIC